MAGRRGRGGRRVTGPGGWRLVLVATSLLLVGCSDEGSTAPDGGTASPGLSPSPQGTDEGTAAAPTLSADGSVDCTAVASAQDDLLAETDAELTRLGVDRGDREAFGVTLFVATRQAPEFWAAVRDALTPDTEARLRADVTDVARHWESLGTDLAAVRVADGSAAAVQRALDELDSVRASLPPERVDAVQVAQERAQRQIDRACGEPLTTGSRGITPGDRAGGGAPGGDPGPGADVTAADA